MKELIDQGKDPDDVRPATSAERLSPVSGPSLADLLLAYSEHEEDVVDIDQLSSDLSFILIDKAKIGSKIFQRIQNVQSQGGVRMYAEVYRWFTETSGQGLVSQAGELLNPAPAANEFKIAEAIEA